jgi:hypothetical protein
MNHNLGEQRTEMGEYFEAALNLHNYLAANFWNGSSLVGPDPGLRFNYRIGRFIKAYLGKISWKDNYCYLQAQGYWVLANWLLFDATCRDSYRDIALRCSDFMLSQQRDDGAWLYPNPEWSGRIANAEGTWGTLGILESYRRTANPTLLAGILRWHKFLTETIGYQSRGDELAVNYFAHETSARVPNNSVTVLRFLAELALVTKDDKYRQPIQGLLTFLRAVQQPSGEFPYSVAGNVPCTPKPHFQCYQYHAFICLSLLRYFEICRDPQVLPIISKVLNFLRNGITDDGHVLYDCTNHHRQVTYHTTAVAAAFSSAERLGLVDNFDAITRLYDNVLRQQKPDGSFPHSQRDYYLLRDSRAYPRYLSMILYHLLLGHLGFTRSNNFA